MIVSLRDTQRVVRAHGAAGVRCMSGRRARSHTLAHKQLFRAACLAVDGSQTASQRSRHWRAQMARRSWRVVGVAPCFQIAHPARQVKLFSC